MKPDGSGLRTFPLGQDVGETRWSPNGAKLAFTMYPSGGRRLYVVNADVRRTDQWYSTRQWVQEYKDSRYKRT